MLVPVLVLGGSDDECPGLAHARTQRSLSALFRANSVVVASGPLTFASVGEVLPPRAPPVQPTVALPPPCC